MTRATVEIEKPTFKKVTGTLSYSSSTPRTASTFAVPFSFGVHIVVTREPTDMEKHH